MARILFLTPRYPYPVIGGDRLRIHAIARELAKSHELTLLSLCETPMEAQQLPDDSVFAHVKCVVLPRWRSLANAAAALPTRTPLQVAYYRSREFGRAVATLAPRHDLIVSHLVRTAEYSRGLAKPRILEMTDAISLNYARVRKEPKQSIRRLVYAVEQQRLHDYERRIIDDFDLSVFVSAIDRSYLLANGDERLAKTLVCSNGVDLTSMPFTRQRNGATIIFIGNMTTLQNIDAARWFASAVLPLLRLRSPSARLRVVGRIDDHGRRNLDLPNVDITGEVEDIGAAVATGTVAVCPMRLGAGVQNKMLEYMALGLATVSTAIGLEGLEAVAGRDLLVADDPLSVAAALAELLEHRDRREALADAGRSYVEAHHSWVGMLRPLVDEVSKLLNDL